MKLPVVRVEPSLRQTLSIGHPWIYRTQLHDEPNRESGSWVEVRAGNFSAIGLWDDEGAIAIRLFSRSLLPDARWLRARVQEAWLAREPLRRTETTAYRWLYGESEGVPGLTVDLYGPFAVIRSYASSLEGLVEPVSDALRAATPLQGIVWRRHRGEGSEEGNEHTSVDAGKVQLLWGQLPPEDLIVREHGLQFRANLLQGQKTGLFLDQRENRKLLAEYARGRSMLNCFAYTGAFGVYALRGGATTVTSCDLAAAAAEESRSNLLLNGYDPDAHPFMVTDCFDLLGEFVQRKRSFDMVVLDPPSFAHSRRQLPGALRAYGRLNTLGIQCVAPGGLLATASCTAQVGLDEFRSMLAGAAQAAGRRLIIIHEAGQPLDHPVAAHFPEGRYLKFVLTRVLPLV
ncbi:MAG: class I SAM-dependent rRNA methyltransferase [Herpetosiphonaceae bacterium]|nr:class I SAM-dependent rRNA methyltransferase [Herpetosiphonaceae bacterium]